MALSVASYKIRPVRITRYEVRNFENKVVARFRTERDAKNWIKGYVAAAEHAMREANR